MSYVVLHSSLAATIENCFCPKNAKHHSGIIITLYCNSYCLNNLHYIFTNITKCQDKRDIRHLVPKLFSIIMINLQYNKNNLFLAIKCLTPTNCYNINNIIIIIILAGLENYLPPTRKQLMQNGLYNVHNIVPINIFIYNVIL